MTASRWTSLENGRRGGVAGPHVDQRELALALRAVRAFGGVDTAVAVDRGDCRPRRGRAQMLALAWFFVILLGLLHAAMVTRFSSYPANSAASAVFGAGNEDVSMQFKKMAAVVSSTLAMSAGAHAQDAVQWRVENGGNGHWYQAMRPSPMPVTFTQQDTFASSVGGYIATLTTEAENSFVIHLLGSNAGETNGVFFGLRRQADGSWLWRDGTTVDFTAWGNSQCVSGPYPNDTGIAGEVCGHLYLQNCGWIWDDTPPYWFSTATNLRLLVEYSADCNSDGIVDYGQIRAGELVDANANNIPDCCEESTSCSPCLGDIDESGTVNGVDLAAILAVWGSDGGKYPRADTNNDGEVNGADLATVLSSWGSCE